MSNILVIGDIMIDKYIYTNISKIAKLWTAKSFGIVAAVYDCRVEENQFTKV